MIAQICIQNWAALVSALLWDVCLCECACMYLGAPHPSCCLDPTYTSISGSRHFIQVRLEDFRLIWNLS